MTILWIAIEKHIQNYGDFKCYGATTARFTEEEIDLIMKNFPDYYHKCKIEIKEPTE